jgi:hypothetical protein
MNDVFETCFCKILASILDVLELSDNCKIFFGDALKTADGHLLQDLCLLIQDHMRVFVLCSIYLSTKPVASTLNVEE